jgi:hypothetical protein
MDRSNDQIIQLNNLTIRKVSGSVPGVVYASQDIGGGCVQYSSVEGSGRLSLPCPLAPTVLYQIAVQPETILLLKNRARANIGDFEVGDRVNVFGFLDRGTSYMHALILRDLDKPATPQFIQLNNLTLISEPSSGIPPASFRAARRGVEPCISFVGAPRGITYPCPMGIEVSALKTSDGDQGALQQISIGEEITGDVYDQLHRPFREYYDVKISDSTRLMNMHRQQIRLGDIKLGDRINVYGRYIPGTRVVEAVILRDLSVPRTPVVADSFKVVSPNGGEVVALGATAVVSWDIGLRPPLSNETIVLSLVDGPSQGVIATLNANQASQGNYRWQVQHIVIGGDAISTILPGAYRLKAELYDGTPCLGFCVQPVTPVKVIANDVSDRQFRIIESTRADDAPVINSLTPSSGSHGTKVTLRGEFARSGNYVYLGGYNAGNDLRSDGDTLTFTIPEYVGVCSHNPYDPPKEPVACMALALQMPEGRHSVYVVNANGTSNSVTFNLTGDAEPPTESAPQ